MAYVIWLTGISGAGKTTLGTKLTKFLVHKAKKQTQFLDGDIVREFFENDLGYTHAERVFNVERIAFTAHMLAQNDVNAVVANIAPYYEVRDFIRRKIPNYIQIYLKASVDKVSQRDVKGHYKKASVGKNKNLIGIDDPYEIPRQPDLVIDTDRESVDESLQKIIALLKAKKVF